MVTLGAAELIELLEGASIDAKGKNIVATCPYCNRSEKFGISIKKSGNPWQCLHAKCGERGKLFKLLGYLDRLDLAGPARVDTTKKLENIIEEVGYEEINLELGGVDLPKGYKRVGAHPYLNSRGFNDDDYFYFEAGTSNSFIFANYVIFPVRDNGKIVGYVSRHIWDKKKIDRYNDKVRQSGEGYKVLRYRNSTDNETGKMLYNYDRVKEGRVHTVIVVEGIFDVINLTRQLDLYEQDEIVVVACFGSKLSKEQVYKLQLKGVSNVILFYDEDAVEKIKHMAVWLQKYFDVLCAFNFNDDRDAGELGREDVLEILDNAQHPYSFKKNVLGRIV
jgi:DNA primase